MVRLSRVRTVCETFTDFVHSSLGTAQQVFDYRPWASLGDEYGFISIYPNASTLNTDQCWDVSSQESLTHNGGGDALGIVSMVRWTLEKYHADKDRVFVTGTSSGAMMTNGKSGLHEMHVRHTLTSYLPSPYW